MRYAILTFIGFLYVACSDRVTNDHGSSDPELMEIVTVSGTGIPGFSGDGGIAVLAQLRQPHSIAFDSRGNLLICDIGNQRLRLVSRETGFIDTIGGTGERIATPNNGPLRGTPVSYTHLRAHETDS